MLFSPEMGVLEIQGRQRVLLAILIGQHPFLAENDRVFPIRSTLLSFHPFLVILYSLPVSYSNRPARTIRCFTHVALRLTTKNQRPTNKHTSLGRKKNKLQSDVFRAIIDSRQCCQLSQNTSNIPTPPPPPPSGTYTPPQQCEL